MDKDSGKYLSKQEVVDRETLYILFKFSEAQLYFRRSCCAKCKQKK